MEKDSCCRLCFSTSEEFLRIFDMKTNEILPEISDLLQTLQLQIKSHDNKSNIICMKCHVKLSDIHQFRASCEKNEKLWDKMSIDTEMNLKVECLEIIVTEKPLKRVKKKEKKASASSKTHHMRHRCEENDAQWAEDDAKIQKFFDFSCPTCDPKQTFTTITTYRTHMRDHHDEKDAKIYCCKRKMRRRYELLEHMAFHMEPNRLTCKTCQRVFMSRKNLRAHIKSVHNAAESKKWECDICKKRFPYFGELRTHMNKHLSVETRDEQKRYLCDDCGRTFVNKISLKIHIDYIHLKKGVVCDTCGKFFITKSVLDDHHKKVHEGSKPCREQCLICHRWYASKKLLRKHVIAVHQRSSTVFCQICGQELASKSSLGCHMRMKHKEKKHICNYCGKAFSFAKALKEHEAMHTGVSLYRCMYCPDKYFNVNTNLYKHLKEKHFNEWQRDKTDKNRDPDKWKKKMFENV